MELKLNIYDKKRDVVKTYTAQDYDVMYGVTEDLLDALDMDALTSAASTDSLFSALAKLLNVHRDIINPLLLDIFDGLTEDELRCTKVKEIIHVLEGVCGFRPGGLKQAFFRGKL